MCSAKNVPGITSGKGSMQSVAKQLTTKLNRGIIQNISVKSSAKIAVSRTVGCALTGGTIMGMMTKDAIEKPVVKPLQNQLDKIMLYNKIALLTEFFKDKKKNSCSFFIKSSMKPKVFFAIIFFMLFCPILFWLLTS